MSGVYKAIAEVQKEMNGIQKNKRNSMQNYNFRGIDDVYNAINPILSKNEVFTIPEVLEEKSEERRTTKGGVLIYRILKIKYTFCHSDGSSVSAIVIGEGMDSGDKASNKAMSVAHKYALFQTFCIPTEEVKKSDPDNETHNVRPKTKNYEFLKAVKKLKELMPEDDYYEIIKGHGQVEHADEITDRRIQETVYSQLKLRANAQQTCPECDAIWDTKNNRCSDNCQTVK